jgi:hypothetical protein
MPEHRFLSRSRLLLIPLLLCFLCSACSFQATARRWNGTYGPTGERVFVKTVTKVGINAFVIIPFFSWCDSDTMVEALTRDIRQENGDRVRIIEFESSFYWLGLIPFTFFATPVVATVTAEYHPSPEELEAQKKREREAWFERALQAQD